MGKTALIFAGQGSQYIGMGKDFYEKYDFVKDIVNRADNILDNMITDVCFNGDLETLSKTKYTQPSMFVHQVICVNVLKELGIKFDGVAGFSLGEYAALYTAGAFDLEQGIKLVQNRGEFMQQAAMENPGAMVAVIGKPDEEIIELIKDVSDVYPVNYNCDGQLVIAGKQEQIDKIINIFEENKVRAKKLNVSGAFHCPLMDGASVKLNEYLKNMDINNMNLDAYSNATSKPYENNVLELLTKQIKSPVLWKQTIKNMIADGYDTFIEVGAGKTLSSLMKKIDKSVTVMNIDNLESLEKMEK